MVSSLVSIAFPFSKGPLVGPVNGGSTFTFGAYAVLRVFAPPLAAGTVTDLNSVVHVLLAMVWVSLRIKKLTLSL